LAKKKKVLPLIKEIRKKSVREVNYGYEKAISYSQLSMYRSCPKKWSLQYRDGHKTSEQSIHMTFGTAVHEAIQHYLDTMYDKSGAAADRIDIEEYFEECFRKTYLKDYKKNKNVHFSNPAEMKEFFDDGMNILNYFKKKRNAHFTKKGWHLVQCELPMLVSPNTTYKNVLYRGYLDVVMYHEPTNTIKIIDIKTSTRGWGAREKKNEDKQFQLILYKKFFAQQYDFPVENIDIEFFIVKRKLYESEDYVIPRIQIFKPASGKIKMSRAEKAMNEFIKDVFTLDAKFKEDVMIPNPSKWNCGFCPYKNKKELCNVGIS
jgi:CRISPR/Cas system-associated exonuclease Cas4 (RecB family)|tara:strand:+ start:366 stop:1319 length:954 start_codon:yes stop_codon:yes gene_type:complete